MQAKLRSYLAKIPKLNVANNEGDTLIVLFVILEMCMHCCYAIETRKEWL